MKNNNLLLVWRWRIRHLKSPSYVIRVAPQKMMCNCELLCLFGPLMDWNHVQHLSGTEIMLMRKYDFK